eukprot:CAMPEP_0172597038 /NCGR_PEP_ID=MMETSP1068-20121228/16964_1 /TAXON_ID=35684 /ORGANISM="Pseudopedinella elastica, Strain CCMP716" /LENGTH=132 /DNA_ID=CAMNT_0013396359 /DNA_START=424 /DNA_END=818 /DNA_ORIENTATION=-
MVAGTLGLAIGAPSLFNACWRVVAPMLGEVTAAKVRFVAAPKGPATAAGAAGAGGGISGPLEGGDEFEEQTRDLGDEMTSWLRVECAEVRRLPAADGSKCPPHAGSTDGSAEGSGLFALAGWAPSPSPPPPR